MDVQTLPQAAPVWIDLLRATDAERAAVEAQIGLVLPSLDDLKEIENSSRLYIENGALFMSLPLLGPVRHGVPATTVPLGFVLTPATLVTLRFDELPGFEAAAARARAAEERGSVAVFIQLLDDLIERSADVLERLNDDLDRISRRIFGEPAGRAPSNLELRATLRGIGRSGEVVTKLRDTLLNLARILAFLSANAAEWTPAEEKPHLKTLRADVASLTDQDSHIQQRVQFLLDATLGFISNEQSNIIKVMTVVSVVFMPPTLVASIYGMNFDHMPELHWAYGYPFALALIVAGAVLPLAWFRARRWL